MGVALNIVEAMGWKRCLSLANPRLRLLVTLDIGPRVISCGPPDGANLLKVFPHELGLRGGAAWRLYGGHRFWVCPETKPYPPDNLPVSWEPLPLGARLTQPQEKGVPWRKILEIRMHPRLGKVLLRHRLINAGRRPLRVAPWALTVFPGGGHAFFPLPRRGRFPAKVNPSGPLVLWPYTDLGDKRWRFGKRHLFLRVPEGAAKAQKLGASVPDGWVAYQRKGFLFKISFRPSPSQHYTDFGSHVELFTQNGMVELETLGEMKALASGKELVHDEEWQVGAAKALPKN